MQKLLRLCLQQAFLRLSIVSVSITSLLTASIITVTMFVSSSPVLAQNALQEPEPQKRGIRMRGPKGSDSFPYERYGPITAKDTLWKMLND